MPRTPHCLFLLFLSGLLIFNVLCEGNFYNPRYGKRASTNLFSVSKDGKDLFFPVRYGRSPYSEISAMVRRSQYFNIPRYGKRSSKHGISSSDGRKKPALLKGQDDRYQKMTSMLPVVKMYSSVLAKHPEETS